MNYYWQISRYREEHLPLYDGAISTWTSVSDIGKVINEKVLSVNEYLTVENLYIQAIKTFMRYSNTDQLFIKQLEKPLSLESITKVIFKKGL